MARDPGSVWAPLPEAGAPDGYTKTQMIYHSTGGTGSARSIRDNWFGRSDVVVESTFIVGKSPSDPTLQMMDSTDNADANGSANQRAISVEVVCTGSEPWTEWQVSECIRLGRWARKTHPILPRIIPSEPSSGFGWHVMFGAPGPWTSAAGKVCPGGPAISQLKSRVFPAIFADTEEDMPLTSDDVNKVADAVVRKLLDSTDLSPDMAGHQSVRNVLSQVWTNSREDLADQDALQAAVKKLPAEVRAALADAIVQVDVSVAQGDQPPAA